MGKSVGIILGAIAVVIFGGLFFLIFSLMNQNAQSQAQLLALEQQQNQSGGIGGIVTGVLGIFGL
jgi:hypothetical protein